MKWSTRWHRANSQIHLSNDVDDGNWKSPKTKQRIKDIRDVETLPFGKYQHRSMIHHDCILQRHKKPLESW